MEVNITVPWIIWRGPSHFRNFFPRFGEFLSNGFLDVNQGYAWFHAKEGAEKMGGFLKEFRVKMLKQKHEKNTRELVG